MRDYLTKKELESLSWRKIERLQSHRFRAIVRNLLPHTKAYSDLFEEYSINPKKIRCVEDWQKLGLPLFKKKYYLKFPKNFVVSPDIKNVFSVHKRFLSSLHKMEALNFIMTALFRPKKTAALLKSFYHPKMPLFSGGTESGAPTPVFITAHQKHLMEKITDDIISVVKTTNDLQANNLTGMNLFPYGPHLAWHATHLAIDIACDLNLNTAAGGAIPTERLALLAKEFKPQIFAGMHEYLRHRFFPVVASQKTVLPMRALIINGAAKMTPGDKEQLAKSAKLAGIIQPLIIDMYGASELKEDLMPECTQNSGFHHIAPLSTIIRTIKVEESNDDFITKWNFTQPQNGGYAAIWTINGAGTLFEGYVLGDHYEKISRDTCPNCNLRTERIYDVNRIKDIEAQLKFTGIVEQKVKGAKINLTALRDRILEQNFVKEVQLVIDKQGRNLLIKFASNLKEHAAILKLQKILRDLEVTPQFEYAELDKLIPKDKKFEPFVVK